MARAKKTKASGLSRVCKSCKFAVKELHTHESGHKYERVVGCGQGCNVLDSAKCSAVEVVCPPATCGGCGTNGRDHETHKGRLLCRSCIMGAEVILKRPLMSSAAADVQQYGFTNINWSLLNRRLGEAMDREGIPRPGFNRREDHQEEWGTIYQGSGK